MCIRDRAASINPGHLHSTLVASDGAPNPALSVDASGNVGIGTTSPGAKLEVSGGASAANILSLTRTTVGEANQWNARISSTFTGTAGTLFFNPSVATADLAFSGNNATPQLMIQGS